MEECRIAGIKDPHNNVQTYERNLDSLITGQANGI